MAMPAMPDPRGLLPPAPGAEATAAVAALATTSALLSLTYRSCLELPPKWMDY